MRVSDPVTKVTVWFHLGSFSFTRLFSFTRFFSELLLPIRELSKAKKPAL